MDAIKTISGILTTKIIAPTVSTQSWLSLQFMAKAYS